MKNLFLIAVIVLGFSAVSFGQVASSVTETSSASATIMTTLTLENVVPLNFGSISSGNAVSTVTLGFTDNRIVASGNAQLVAFGDPATTAEFAITGNKNAAFSITLPASLELAPGLIITTFSSNLGTTSSLDLNGDQTLKVGGTLSVGADQAAGSFSANYDVSINYN